MSTSRMFGRLAPALGLCAAAAALAACSGAQQGAGGAVPPAASQGVASAGRDPRASLLIAAKTIATGMVPTIHHNSGKSWILPDGGSKTLLYTSDYGTGTVNIYDYYAPSKLYGQITGFEQPYGQCVDKSGNVYVADFGTSKIYEFAHGATTPSAVAYDGYGYAIGCAVDPTTGNLAVATYEGFGYTSGGIDVFAGGPSGAQTYYTNPTVYFMWPPAYDSHGNLFVEGENETGQYTAFAELPHGNSNFDVLAGVSIVFPGGVARFGKYLAVTDQTYKGGMTSAIYTVTTSGSTATIIHTSDLTDDCAGSQDYTDVAQPIVVGTGKKALVVTGNSYCTNRFDFWNLANGGNPTRELHANIAPYYGYGEAVSSAK